MKQDAVPGMTIPVWFEATRTGEFPLACAELCGLGHYRMRASLTVHEAADFDRWQAEEIAASGPPAGIGETDAERAEESEISEAEESA